MINKVLLTQIKNLPQKPGVYIFKNEQNVVLYIGKAKNLKNRVYDYIANKERDLKSHSILSSSTQLEHIITKNELEAMLIEAKLIQAYQPNFNVLLKTGQPFLYLMVTSGKIPELKIVRNQKQKGSYFGPFIDKNSARKVYDFLIKTFRLKLCKKKIPNGCLFYHLGICAGACKPDFNLPEYLERLELAKLALKNNHKEFTEYISRQMAMHNKKMEFEQSKKLNEYRHAFQNIFTMIDAKTTKNASLDYKDIWYLTEDKNILFLFKEQNSILTKKDIFYMPISENFLSYFEGYYHQNSAPAIVLINFELPEDTRKLYQNFLGQWHHKTQPITLMLPKEGHFADLIKLAKIHAEMEQEKQGSVAKALKTLLRLPKEPHSIDCFDISHKQGKFMVGSCVRFIDGKPDKSNLRHFHIKTLDQQNDCAALAEIVTRRYKDKEVPDLILIDGGKGQLNAVLKYMPDAEFASLAKREEIIYTKRLLKGRKLNIKTFAGQLLIALRDYAHHFAISFHRNIEKLS